MNQAQGVPAVRVNVGTQCPGLLVSNEWDFNDSPSHVGRPIEKPLYKKRLILPSPPTASSCLTEKCEESRYCLNYLQDEIAMRDDGATVTNVLLDTDALRRAAGQVSSVPCRIA